MDSKPDALIRRKSTRMAGRLSCCERDYPRSGLILLGLSFLVCVSGTALLANSDISEAVFLNADNYRPEEAGLQDSITFSWYHAFELLSSLAAESATASVTNKQAPPPPPPPSASSTYSCRDWARVTVAEPFTDRYKPRTSLYSLRSPWSLNGLSAHSYLRRSTWLWEDHTAQAEGRNHRITWADFQAALSTAVSPDTVVHYKILGGRLWMNESSKVGPDDHQELLRFMLYLYGAVMPDMEFLYEPIDDCLYGRPTFKFAICRRAELSKFYHWHDGDEAAASPPGVHHGGFNMIPYEHWSMSLGPTQMAAYHSCLDQRYPPDNRIPKVVWRGSTTNSFPTNTDNFDQAPRFHLHELGQNHPDVLDAGYVSPITNRYQVIPEGVRAINGSTLPRLSIEEFNRYCAVIDLDGNMWSNRFGVHLIHFPTPTLRMTTPFMCYFDHMYAPGYTYIRFSRDMRKLVPLVREVIKDCVQGGAKSQGQRLARQMRLISRKYMDHVGIAEAMADTLISYHNLTTWQVDPSVQGFKEVKFAEGCCRYAKLPKEVIDAMNRLDGFTSG